MRKVSVLIGICMLVALALTVLAQQEPFDLAPIMKDIAAANASLNMNLNNGAAEGVAADAAKLQENFTKSIGFFKAMKAEEAVGWSKANADAAAEVVKAAKSGNLEGAKAPAKTIGASCKSCHSVHREQLPDKTYKFKAKQ
jgi:cytochrome c556